MPLDNSLDGNNEIAHFLEKFKETEHSHPAAEPDLFSAPEKSASVRPGSYARSFEKLEQKIHELEEKFEASTTQNHLILSELSRTREVMERQKDKDAFLEHLSRTIATLRTSVENLARAQETHSFSYRETPIQRSFDPIPSQSISETTAASLYAAEQETARLRQERDEQDRLFVSLRQKASQLKAVNSALDREIKKAQQEKLDALRKSADQAKEILSLRDQLTAAEERFKSFDFEGRIISIKREYQQKVSTLEIQLKEMSDTCMRQVEEIESLKAKNIELQAAAAEKETLQAQLAQKDKQLRELKEAMAALQAQQSSNQGGKQASEYTARLRTLEEQRAQLSLALEKSQLALGALRREKELLEKNFKELMVKINHNDSVIGQMKEKIDVLARHNTELTHRNSALVQRNQELSQTASVLMTRNESLAQTNLDLTRDNQTLSANNANLTRDNETLYKNNANLARDNEALSKNNASLARDNEELTKTNLHLTRNNEVLAQKAAAPRPKITLKKTEKPAVAPTAPAAPVENNPAPMKAEQPKPAVEQPAIPAATQTAPVPKSSAALLAARLVQQHAQRKNAAAVRPAEKAVEKANTSSGTEVVSSADDSLRDGRTAVLHSLGRTLQQVPTTDEEEWEVVSAQVPTAVRTEEDLPEIKVADPVAQDSLFDGEDFLEKTNSFIGRMKWSIFRENR